MKDYPASIDGQLKRIADLIERHVNNYTPTSDVIGVQLLNQLENLNADMKQRISDKADKIKQLIDLINGPVPHTEADARSLERERAAFSELSFIQVKIAALITGLRASLTGNPNPTAPPKPFPNL